MKPLADQSKHERLMKRALYQARKADQLEEVPVGAVIVYKDRIIARGHNLRQSRQDVTLHAEMIALRQACRRLSSWRLEDCDIYVTLEPCIMCAGALIQARIRSLYFGARDPKTGACGSFVDLFALRHNHEVHVQGDILADESTRLLQAFFSRRR
jgi:tRNA(adenine34) deaminase